MPAKKIYYILRDSEDEGKLVSVTASVKRNAPRFAVDNGISVN